MDVEQETNISRAVIDLYASLPNHGKAINSEFTVLAAILLVSEKKFEIVSLATGTKCIGSTALEADKFGCLLSDSHAEVLARRGFQRYLLKCMLALVKHKELAADKKFPLDLNFQFSMGGMKLKPGFDVYLFVSDSPCGDSSIYPLRSDVHDEIIPAKINFTGAKLMGQQASCCLATTSPAVWQREDTQVLGCLRTKSGRSDTTLSNRTVSKSCSDKISKWNFVGLQG